MNTIKTLQKKSHIYCQNVIVLLFEIEILSTPLLISFMKGVSLYFMSKHKKHKKNKNHKQNCKTCKNTVKLPEAPMPEELPAFIL